MNSHRDLRHFPKGLRPPVTRRLLLGRLEFVFNCEVPVSSKITQFPKGPKAPESSQKLQGLTDELRLLQALLTAGIEFDPRILSEFRDTVNRVRTTAWAMQQYIENAANDRDPKKVLTLLAGERIRAAYQLCELIRADLKNEDVQFQKGQLLELNEAVQSLAKDLAEEVKKY